MFYNVENLFDTEDDPVLDDQEFLPGSDKQWTRSRYFDKLDKIAKVIRDVGGDAYPALVGLCEIENRRTLEDLIGKTSLKDQGYSILHKDSPDERGIDVALLYRQAIFKLIDSEFIPVRFPADPKNPTRDILYAKGIFAGDDTVHLFVGHWPSRSAGEAETRPLRLFVAETIRNRTETILARSANAKIIITGDFNDEPEDLSVVAGLRALLSFATPSPARLYDLTAGLKKGKPGGSYKYKGTWQRLDHMVVSGGLLSQGSGLFLNPADIDVLHKDYLLEADETFMGLKPKRTYNGPVYNGGYSDHLPVFVTLRVTANNGK
jgi:endonuclease/exonuclease/phosphatase family metal-dependent hydrolase